MFAADVIRLCLQEMGWSHTSAVKGIDSEFSLQMERWFQDRELEPPESPPSSYGSRCWLTWMLGLDAFSGRDPRVEVLGLPKTSGSETVNSPFPSVGNIGLKSPEIADFSRTSGVDSLGAKRMDAAGPLAKVLGGHRAILVGPKVISDTQTLSE